MIKWDNCKSQKQRGSLFDAVEPKSIPHTLMCKPNAWGSCSSAHFSSLNPGMGMKFCSSTNTLPPYPEGSMGHIAVSRDCNVICDDVANRNDSLDERPGIKTPGALTASLVKQREEDQNNKLIWLTMAKRWSKFWKQSSDQNLESSLWIFSNQTYCVTFHVSWYFYAFDC